MIELEPLEEEDKLEVRQLVQNHFDYTGSDPAEWILTNWEIARELFIKIMPRDYKEALEKQKKQKELTEVN